MVKPSAKPQRQTPLGLRLRKRRKELGRTQTSLAQELGISVSYLNLIEHNKRAIAGKLLHDIARALDIELDRLEGAEDARLIQEVTEISGDMLFHDFQLEQAAPQELIARYPNWGKAIIHLYRSYLVTNNMVNALSDGLNRDPYLAEASHRVLSLITSIRSFAEILEDDQELSPSKRQRFSSLLASESERLGDTASSLFEFVNDIGSDQRPSSPAVEVDDFIIDHQNYFPALEEQAEKLRHKVLANEPALAQNTPNHNTPEGALISYLADTHKITIRYSDGAQMQSEKLRSKMHYDAVRKEITLLHALPKATMLFQLAQFLFDIECADALSAMTDTAQLTTDEARRRAHHAMARYGAGAFIFPYDAFFEAAEHLRYDIEILAQRFRGSFEQICHRLVTLRKPGAIGVPFAFLRSDIAGNISKRYSLPNLRIPRQGNACPLWAAYRAFLTPERLVTQPVIMPDNNAFLFIARTVSKQVSAFGAPQQIYSVMLGCHETDENRLVYSDCQPRLNTQLRIPVGVNCRLCPYPDCQHRAFEPILPPKTP